MKTQVLISEKLSYLLDVPLDHATMTHDPNTLMAFLRRLGLGLHLCLVFCLGSKELCHPGESVQYLPQKNPRIKCLFYHTFVRVE